MDIEKEVKRQLAIIQEGATEIVPLEELESKLRKSLKENKPLRIKQGIDPTSPDVHIGHMVPFKKMRQFQDLGHIGVLIIGDYTARIGDPTGRNVERIALTPEEVKKNAETYTEQIFKVVRSDKTEIHYQTEWFDDFNLQTIIKLAAKFSVAQMLAHDTFRNRLESGERLSLHEMLYPLLQAYDSVAINADVELGGTDQKFNILCGRDLMKEYGLEPQVALLMPLLMGTNGIKMSKSMGNHIPIFSSPNDKFGKVMSISDDLILNYYLYATNKSKEEIEEVERKLKEGVNPRDIKIELAKEIISIYHSQEDAINAANEFIKVFSEKEVPTDIETYKIGSEKVWICKIMLDNNMVPSLSEARRLIKQNAVSLDNEKVTNIDLEIEVKEDEEKILKVGKRRFLKIIR